MNLQNSGKETIVILTTQGYLSLNRTVLRPRDKEEINKLVELTGKKSVVPLDIALKIDDLPFKITRNMMLKIAKDAIEADSYDQMSRKYMEEKNISISNDEIRLVTDFIGAQIFDQDKKRSQYALSTLEKDKKSRKMGRKTGGILYLLMDGAFIEMVSKDGGWKEVKTAMCFNSKDIHYWKNSKNEEQHRILKRDFISIVGSVDDFIGHVAALFKRNNGHKIEEVVVISDRADWINTVIEKVCPNATHILDLAHLKEKVGTFAQQVISDETQRTAWVNDIRQKLEDGKWNEVLSDPSVIANKDIKTTGGKVNLYKYIDDRKDQIDYPLFRAKGYFVGSGAIESANRYIPQRRLKLPGMRWRRKNAQGILSLRSRLKAEKWREVEKNVEIRSFSKK